MKGSNFWGFWSLGFVTSLPRKLPLTLALLPGQGWARALWRHGLDDAAQVPQCILEAVIAAPRRQVRLSRQVERPSAGAFDCIKAGADVAERLERCRFEHVEKQAGKAAPASQLYQLRAHLPYWVNTMQQIGLVSAPVQSIITDDCCPDWDPAKGPDLPILLPKLPSARAEAALGGNPSTRMYKMLATAQRVFTTVMGHTVLFPRYMGIRVPVWTI